MSDTAASLTRRGTAFLRRRPRALGTLLFCSLLESTQTFLFGYAVAQALDHGFLVGLPVTGLGWLGIAAAAAVLGAGGTANSYHGLAALTEPLRDTLVRRVVRTALRGAVANAGRSVATSDTAAVSRLTHQVELARDSFAGLVSVARSFVFTAAGALVGLASLDPLLLMVVLPPAVAGFALFAATLRPMSRRQQAFLRADERIAEEGGAVASGLRDVTACAAEEAVAGRMLEAVDAEARASRALARWSAARMVALGVSGRLPMVLLLVAAPWLLGRGVTVGALAGALTYLTQSLLPAQEALMQGLGGAGVRLTVVLRRLLTEGQAEPGAPGVVASPVDEGAAVELSNVTFGYGSGAQPILRNLDLRIRTGEHLAIVGPSGIGKSTLAALMTGLRAPDSGEVRIADHPDGAVGQGAPLADRRVLIPQEAYVFTGTLRENLTYLGDPGTAPGTLDATAALFGLSPLVARLGGWDAPFDPAAAELSSGERQLIALARAYLSPAPLAVLDEATSHLDPPAEARAERAFAARPGGTLVVIAHRLSSALRARRVLVMDGDRVLSGTHEELLRHSPLYRDLVGHWSAA